MTMLYKKLIELQSFIEDATTSQHSDYISTKNLIRDEIECLGQKLDKAENTITSQQRTIEQLTNALKDKYEHGLFIFSEDGKLPIVIRNGKEQTNDLTSYFKIEWNHGEFPNITIEQIAGTYVDSEM